MKNAIRVSLLIILLCGSFFLGYIFSISANQKNNIYTNDAVANALATAPSAEIMTTTEAIEEPTSKSTIEPTPRSGNLSEEDQAFLEEHIYGYWVFNRRVFELDENNNDMENLRSNISDEGVKSLLESGIQISDKSISQDVSRIRPVAHLTNPVDTYLLGLYGIFNVVVNPVYGVSTVNTKDLLINDKLVNIKSPLDIFDTESITKVSYSLGKREDLKAFVKIEIYETGGTFYVPYLDDKDTLYIDFCGIWELKRSENPYLKTNGKSLYGY